MITVRQAARVRQVVNRDGQIDYMAQCPLCPSGRGHNRIRTANDAAEIERVDCEHLIDIERKVQGATFVFSSKA